MQTLRERPLVEAGARPIVVLDLPAAVEYLTDSESPLDGHYAEIASRYTGRDIEPITGATAIQFEQEARNHPERYRFLVDWLVDALGPVRPHRILDAGAGPGLLTELLMNRWPDASVTAVDLSPDMVELARARSRSSFAVVEGDVRRISDIRDGPLDAVVSRRMIHRVDDLHDVLGRVLATLQPAGVFANYSFRRPGTLHARNAFLEAARVRAGEPELHAAFVRAVLNAPTLRDYAHALVEVAIKHDVSSIKLLVFPFDVGFIVTRRPGYEHEDHTNYYDLFNRRPRDGGGLFK